MNLYRAQVKDAPKLAQVHVDSWQVAYKGIVPDTFLQGFTYQKREEAFRNSLAAGLEETYLWEINGVAAGILTIGASRDADLDPSITGEIWASTLPLNTGGMELGARCRRGTQNKSSVIPLGFMNPKWKGRHHEFSRR